MKNRFLFFFISLFLSATVFAQTGRIGEHAAIGNWNETPNNFANASQGRQMVERILDAVGLKANFEIRPARIQNAAAIVYGGKRYILYDPDFIAALVKKTGTEWAS